MGPLSVFSHAKISALHQVTGEIEGLTKDGKPANPAAARFSLFEALAEEFDSDAHAVCYTIPGYDHTYRLAKISLGQLHALGVFPECATIFLDIDLCHLLGRRGKVSWDSLEPDQREQLWQRLRQPVPGLPPAAAIHTTKHGAHFVHLLALNVPAGAPFEAVLRRVHALYNAADLPVDPACMDWTRMYRLPRVLRDGDTTSDKPWFRIETNDDPDVFYVPEQEDLDTKETAIPVSYTAQIQDDRPDDEKALAPLRDARGANSPLCNQIIARIRSNPLAQHIADLIPIPEGKRNDTIVKLCGLLSSTGQELPVLYGMMLRPIQILNQDEDWRGIAWRKLNEFRQADQAKKAAAAKSTPTPATDNATPETEDSVPTTEEEEAAPQQEDDGLDIPEELVPDGAGKPKACSANLRYIMRDRGISVRFDEFNRSYVISGFPKFGEKFSDAIIRELARIAEEQYGISMPTQSISDWIQNAGDHRSFHPVREYLASLKWDGIARVERWLSIYADAEETPYTVTIGAVSLVACVRRVMQPGCKHDTMLLLEGPQGGNKSTALKVLAANEAWYGDDVQLGDDGKKTMENISGKWIVEAAEVVGLRKGDTDKLKSFLSRAWDRGRLAYARVPEERPRQFVIFGTTNHTNYLNDDTGNRRFWPVHVTNFDIASLRRDIDQIWAETVELYNAERYYVMDPSLYKEAAREQEQRETVFDDPIYDALSDFSSLEEGIVSKRDLWSALEVSINNGGGGLVGKRVKAILAKMGWIPHRKTWDKGIAKTYYEIIKLGPGKFKLRAQKNQPKETIQ